MTPKQTLLQFSSTRLEESALNITDVLHFITNPPVNWSTSSHNKIHYMLNILQGSYTYSHRYLKKIMLWNSKSVNWLFVSFWPLPHFRFAWQAWSHTRRFLCLNHSNISGNSLIKAILLISPHYFLWLELNMFINLFASGCWACRDTCLFIHQFTVLGSKTMR